MARYCVRPVACAEPIRAEWDGYSSFSPSLTVDTDYGVDTGLVDQNGYAIVRQPNAIGFHAEIED